jgi:hypothetical protein
LTTKVEFVEIVKEMVADEVNRLLGRAPSKAFKKMLEGATEIAPDEEVEFELTEDMMPGSGGYKKRLRKKGGKLVVVKKRKKKLPLHLRKIKPSQAKRIARKSAIKRKGKQQRISKKAAKTTKKGRARGLYKAK